MVIQTVNAGAKQVEIKQHFVGYIPVESSTGFGLAEACLQRLQELQLPLANCRGHGYDKWGQYMRGIQNGVQRQILDKNPRAFYVSCACHSLNLVLADIAKSSEPALSLFGILHVI